MRNHGSSWTHVRPLRLFAIVVAGALATGVASATITRVLRTGGGQPASVFAGLQLAISGDPSGFALAARLHGTVTLIRVLDLLAVFILLSAIAVGLVWWLRYRQSDRHFIHELRGRDGLAKPGEVRKHTSARTALRRAKTLRPSLVDPTPSAAGWKVGSAHGQDVYVSIEDSIVVEGAPRSGKGYRFIINAILDWDGPLITTSTRNDNLSATMRERARVGEVTVFDPQELSGVRSSLRISPVTGCEDPLVADQRGQAIVAGTALGASKTNQEWAQVSSSVLSRLLHAAAVSGRGADALARWGSNPRLALEAVTVLANQGTPGWSEDLDAIINGDEKLLANSWFGVSGALRPLAIPAIRKAMTPGPGEQFDLDAVPRRIQQPLPRRHRRRRRLRRRLPRRGPRRHRRDRPPQSPRLTRLPARPAARADPGRDREHVLLAGAAADHGRRRRHRHLHHRRPPSPLPSRDRLVTVGGRHDLVGRHRQAPPRRSVRRRPPPRHRIPPRHSAASATPATPTTTPDPPPTSTPRRCPS